MLNCQNRNPNVYLVSILILFSLSLQAQIRFLNFDDTNGLPLDEINVIAEDSLGFIWLGGPQGLARFDGHEFIHYYPNGSNPSPAGYAVMDIDVSPSGKVISVFNDNGISIYDHAQDSFDNWTYSTSQDSLGPKHSIIKGLIVNDTLFYLIANFEGVYKMNIPQKKFQKLDLPLTRTPIDLIKNTSSLDGDLLFSRGGIQSFDEQTKNFNWITKIGGGDIEIRDNTIYVKGYSKGIFGYEVDNGRSFSYMAHFPGVIRGAILFKDQVWMGTAEGISVVNQKTGELEEILRADQANSNLPGTFVYDIFQDSKGRVWVSTDGGLSIYDPNEVRFTPSSKLNKQSSYIQYLEDSSLLSMDFYSREIKRTGIDGLESFMKIPSQLEHPITFLKDGRNEILLCFNGIGLWNKESERIELLDCPYTQANTRGLIDLIPKEDVWLGAYRFKDYLIIWDKVSNTTDTIQLEHEPRGMIQLNEEEVSIYGIDLFTTYNLKSKSIELFRKYCMN